MIITLFKGVLEMTYLKGNERNKSFHLLVLFPAACDSQGQTKWTLELRVGESSRVEVRVFDSSPCCCQRAAQQEADLEGQPGLEPRDSCKEYGLYPKHLSLQQSCNHSGGFLKNMSKGCAASRYFIDSLFH